jgi:Cys-rich protein (TIGR01571 family)
MKIREKFGIKGNYCMDCLTYACDLGLCAAVQEYREVKLRSFK